MPGTITLVRIIIIILIIMINSNQDVKTQICRKISKTKYILYIIINRIRTTNKFCIHRANILYKLSFLHFSHFIFFFSKGLFQFFVAWLGSWLGSLAFWLVGSVVGGGFSAFNVSHLVHYTFL